LVVYFIALYPYNAPRHARDLEESKQNELKQKTDDAFTKGKGTEKHQATPIYNTKDLKSNKNA